MVDLEIVTLTEISQKKTNKWFCLYVESKKMLQIYEISKYSKPTYQKVDPYFLA